MTKLKRRDYGLAYTLVEHCRQVGEDPYLWRLRFAKGLTDLFDCATGYIGDHKIMGEITEDGWIRPYSLVDFCDLDESGRDAFWDWVLHWKPEQNPMVQILMSEERFFSKRLNAMIRSEGVDDETWYASPFYQVYSKAAGLDDMLGVSYQTETGEVYWVVLQRFKGDQFFDRRDKRLLSIITKMIVDEIGASLAAVETDSMLHLPRRERQTLLRLLEGDSEKQVASALGISVHTVHQYIRRMYRRYDIDSRGELLVRARALSAALNDSLLQEVDLDHQERLQKVLRTKPDPDETA